MNHLHSSDALPLRCTTCSRPLSGGLDTYGTTNVPLCSKCWHDGFDVKVVEDWEKWLEENKPDDRQQKLDL